jgi:hypothetical protein
MADDKDGPFNIPPKVRAAREFIKHVSEIEANQRRRELEDLAFQVPENVWTKDAKEARKGGVIVGGVPTAARPMVSIPKLNQPINGIVNQARNAQLGVTIHPTSEDADDDTAEVMRDLYRMIERDSRAPLARLWSLERAANAGRGAYRVMTEYDQDSDHPLDQKIVIRRILRQETAYFDTAAEEPDWSDGREAAIVSWIPLTRLKQQHPKSNLSKASDADFAGLLEVCPDWVSDTGKGKAALVVEYFKKVYTTETVWGYAADGSYEVAERPSKPWDQAAGDQTRPRERCEVHWCKLTAIDVLEEETLNGQYIPLIPVVGRELIPFDAERRWQGIIYPNRDAARLFNTAASNVVEIVSAGAKQSMWMAEGQQEGHEAQLQQANVRNFPYNLYKPVIDEHGNQTPPPFRLPSVMGDLAPAMELLQSADGYIQAGTSTVDPAALEKLARKKVAHQTLGQLADQSLTGNSDYLWSLAEISMVYEAKVVLDLIPKIYDRPGRIAKLLNEEGDTRTVMLNQPFTIDPRTKRPMRVGAGQTPGAQGEVKNYDLRKGKYAVSVSIGKSYRDRVDQGQTELGEILSSPAGAALMPVLGPIYFKFRDFPGHQEAADLMKRWRAMQFPGLDAGEDKVMEAQHEAQALKAQLQALGDQYKQAVEYIEREQAKHDAQIEQTRIKAETDITLQQMKDATQIAVKEIEVMAKGAIVNHEATHEALALGIKHAHEREMAERANATAMAQAALTGATSADAADRGHSQNLEMADRQAATDAQAAERGHAQALEAGDVEHQRALEAADRAAELAPEPEAGA